MPTWMGKEIDPGERSPRAGLARFGAALMGRGRKKAGVKTPTAQERMEPVIEAREGIDVAQEADIEGMRAAEAANQARAQAELDEAKLEQEAVGEKFDVADVAAEEGLKEVQEQIEATREGVNKLPEEVQQEFDYQQTKIDEGLEQARTGLGEQRTEALNNVMDGRASAMDAAVASVHSASRQQIASINAQVQQGTLSPSQAEAMKAQVRMGASMKLSAAVGQTAHMFTQTQAETATAFGQQFTQMESQAIQSQGVFGATAAGTFSNAMSAAAQFNVQLTALDAQATSQRNASLSQNATARATFQNNNDLYGMGMQDYTQDMYIGTAAAAINSYNTEFEVMGALVRSDEFLHTMELMRKSEKAANWGNIMNIGMDLIKLFA